MEKTQKDILLFRAANKDQKKETRPAPYNLRTYLLPDDFLASRNLARGDEVEVNCGMLVEDGQLAVIETKDQLVFIGYIRVNKDGSTDLYGPDDEEPYLSYRKGEYEIVGPVGKAVARLTNGQKLRKSSGLLRVLKLYTTSSQGD